MKRVGKTNKMPAANERFGATAAVTPQKMLWEIERLSPATKVVEAAAAPSRHPVVCNVRERGKESRENLYVKHD